MPKDPKIKKVLMLGSGPIVIGQAAEFDYAGTQACRALKEEGIEVVLVNSNPATIMTDKDIADHVYIEPMNLPSITQVIEKERPDALLPNMGGQTGLNLAMALYENGTLEKYGVKLLGTSPASIHKAEDRQGFKDCMESIGQPCVTSKVVNTVEDAVAFANEIGYPVIVRPAYTLGGTGGGIAYDQASLEEISDRGLNLSRVHEVLIERCISGWKEIEFEVMRDGAGNVITICSMENIDPVGVHTGDSIVVAPTQTLANKEFQMLRSAALDPGDRGRVQRAVRPEPRLLRVRGHRGQPPRVPLLRPGLQGHRLPHRQGGGQGGPGLHPGRDPQRGHRQDQGLLRAHHRLRGAEDPPPAL